MAVTKLSIGEVNAGPFEAINAVITRVNSIPATEFEQAANIPQYAVDFADLAAATAAVNGILTALKTAGLMVADA
ncbi:hypothetical protein D3C85_494510 [compost metagenome]